MKIRSIAALITAAAIVSFVSCHWFKSKKPGASNPLLGKWQLDSVRAGSDSGIAHLFSVKAMAEDNGGIRMNFLKDTVFVFSKGSVDTTLYQFDGKEDRLQIRDTSNSAYHYKKISDSLVSLTSKDSAVFFLKKE